MSSRLSALVASFDRAVYSSAACCRSSHCTSSPLVAAALDDKDIAYDDLSFIFSARQAKFTKHREASLGRWMTQFCSLAVCWTRVLLIVNQNFCLTISSTSSMQQSLAQTVSYLSFCSYLWNLRAFRKGQHLDLISPIWHAGSGKESSTLCWEASEWEYSSQHASAPGF